MNVKYKLIPLVSLMLMLPGCGGWVWLDGSTVDSGSIKAAEKQCRIEERMDNLERAEDARDEQLSRAETDQARRLARENFDRIERQTDAEIRSCMRKLGLKPSQ